VFKANAIFCNNTGYKSQRGFLVVGGPYTWTDVTCMLLAAFTFRSPSSLTETKLKVWEKEGKELRENPLR